MSVSSCLLVDWSAQIKHLDDTGRTQIEVLADNLYELVICKLTCAKCIYHD